MFEDWNPPIDISERELTLLQFTRKQKLWGFLREYRHVLLDEETQVALAEMYSSTGKGLAVAPERLALAMLLQIAFKVPDHEVPTLTLVDQRWRMVLDCLDDEFDEPFFSQGTVYNFRERAREHGLMRFLLDKTVAIARETKGFSHKRLRAMIDSSPLVGAGRVEDTFNLIGRALKSLVAVAAVEAERSEQELAEELSLSVVAGSSVKAALDVDWRLPEARNEALRTLTEQLARFMAWLETQFTAETLAEAPLSEAIALVDELVEQDTEPDPDAPEPGRRRIKTGGKDRRVSIHDADQRHGRKSKTKLFVGYKRHVVTDADVPGLVVAVEVMAANVREYAAAPPLFEEVETMGFDVTELHIDRGYLPSEAVHDRRREGMRLVSKPPSPNSKRKRFGKADFDVDAEAGTVTCCGGHTVAVRPTKAGPTAAFPRKTCRACALSSQCLPPCGQKKITLHPYEALHQQMAQELDTPAGRAARRERVAVEHALARLGAIQGAKARYRGLPKNQFHAEACAVVGNCHAIGRALDEAA